MAGSDIQTNPLRDQRRRRQARRRYTKQVDKLPAKAVLDEIDKKVDIAKLEKTLMDEGTKKFADPFKLLLKQIADKRKAVAPSGR